jgi:hypothetical protein
MLGMMGAAWVAARVVVWDTPIVPETALAQSIPGRQAEDLPRRQAPPALKTDTDARSATNLSLAPQQAETSLGSPRVSGAPLVSEPALRTAASPVQQILPPPGPPADPPPIRSVPKQDLPAAAPNRPLSKRWSIDGWYAWRSGSGSPRRAAGVPLGASYGGSQGGILARLDLATGDRRPQAFVRLTHAPDLPSQSDLAFGVGLRPIGEVPLRLQAEARATRIAGRVSVAPAATLVSEVPVIALPFGLSAEGYGQTGWVGGEFDTAFVDGQVRLSRRVTGIGPVDLELGAGVWGGAQKFASRLDVGPSVTLDLRPAGVPARLALDYRQRVVGSAVPGDGIAVTLSTGF